MFSTISQQLQSPSYATRAFSRKRGTAITETLLVFIPVWTFFALSMHVLQYWEGEHIDKSTEMGSQFTRQTITGPFFDMGYKPDAENPANRGMYKFYSEKVEDSAYGGSATASNPKLPKYYFYVTDQQGRKTMIYRGTNTWVPFIWLRGEHFGPKEDDLRRSWYEDMGNSTLEKNRKPLMLGS